MLLLLAFCGTTTAVMAQTEEGFPALMNRVVTNGFWDNWFVDAGVTHLSSYSSQEHGLGLKKNPFWTGRRNWGAELSVGKWATPIFGMRMKGQLNWATQVNSITDPENPTYNQYSLSFQPMINLTNLFGGYKARWWEVSLYGGAGFLHNTSIDEIYALAEVGVMNTWNVTKRFHINLDVYGRMGKGAMDGNEISTKDSRFGSRDLQLGFSAGIGVNLGKVGWDRIPDMDAILAKHKNQIAALNATIAGLETENADVKRKLARKPKEKEVVRHVTEFASTNASVFFNIGESVIVNRKDLVNVKQMADYAKVNDKTVVVVGYADSATGSASYNQKLSKMRAQAVAAELEKMGIAKNKIEIIAQGGVAELNPVSYNRRADVILR